MRNQRKRKPIQKKSPERPPDPPPHCKFPDCGRPVYARKLCQSHHRQMLTVGTVKPIRPYRKRGAETVKFAGFRLTPDCAGKIQKKVDQEGISRGAAIAEILQGWLEQGRP